MLVESLLPLGKLDPGLREPHTPLQIGEFADGAALAEQVGLDAVLVEETKDDPFQLLALGATTTSDVQLGTSVAMAFPRSPTITAMHAWTLQKYSRGRFTLGLGSQVRRIVTDRFSADFDRPAKRMGEYVQAMRTVWNMERGERAPFRGEPATAAVAVEEIEQVGVDHAQLRPSGRRCGRRRGVVIGLFQPQQGIAAVVPEQANYVTDGTAHRQGCAGRYRQFDIDRVGPVSAEPGSGRGPRVHVLRGHPQRLARAQRELVAMLRINVRNQEFRAEPDPHGFQRLALGA